MVSNTCILLGRGAKETNLYTEIAESIHAYGITSHRHGNSYTQLATTGYIVLCYICPITGNILPH